MDLRNILPAGHSLLDCIDHEAEYDGRDIVWKWKTSYKDFNIAFKDYFFLKNNPAYQ